EAVDAKVSVRTSSGYFGSVSKNAGAAGKTASFSNSDPTGGGAADARSSSETIGISSDTAEASRISFSLNRSLMSDSESGPVERSFGAVSGSAATSGERLSKELSRFVSFAETGASGSSAATATGFISNASSFPPHVGQNVNFSAKPSSHAPQ